MNKKMIKLLIALCFTTTLLSSAEEGNILIQADPVQVTTEISPYETITENTPITGTLMITHNSNLKVDEQSFQMGKEPIKVKPLKQVQLDPNNKLVISIYQFELAGRKNGLYTLPPILVRVGGTEYQAPPLTFTVGP